MKYKTVLSSFVVMTLLAVAGGVAPAAAAPSFASEGPARQVSIAGTTSPQTGEYSPSGVSDVTQAEFPGQMDEADGGP